MTRAQDDQDELAISLGRDTDMGTEESRITNLSEGRTKLSN
jgi:hypothetical protein